MRNWTIVDMLSMQKCPRAFWERVHSEEREERRTNRIPLSREAAEALAGDVTDMHGGGPIPNDALALWGLSAEYDGCSCVADLLVDRGDGWELILDTCAYEVHEPHIREAAFILRILEGNGIPVAAVTALFLTRGFVRKTPMDWNTLYQEKDITRRARAFAGKIPARLDRMREVAELPEPPEPEFREGCIKPQECPHWNACTAQLPQPNVFLISGLSMRKKLALYAQGIVSFPDCLAKAELQPDQKQQVLSELLSEPPRVRVDAVRAFLKVLWYPMCFLDFESCQPPIPPFDDMRPFEQMAFQYSLHIVREPGAEPEHTECIVPPGEDPRPYLAEGLVNSIPDGACTVVYSSGLEKQVVSMLASRFPALRRRLNRINANMRDLIVPFRARDYYARAMHGSCSLKRVAPAVFPDDPELSYDRLEGVQNGQEAMRAYLRAEFIDNDDWDATRASLSAYCAVDTLAMVRLVEALQKAAAEEAPDSDT